MYPLSIRLSELNRKFMEQYLTDHKEAKSAIINRALDLYRRYKLQRDLIGIAMANEEEDKRLSEADFKDYLKIVDED